MLCYKKRRFEIFPYETLCYVHIERDQEDHVWKPYVKIITMNDLNCHEKLIRIHFKQYDSLGWMANIIVFLKTNRYSLFFALFS